MPEPLKPRLTTVLATFDQTRIPSADLVNASFALPFCEPQHFAGQFFGDRDSWAPMSDRVHHSRDEVAALFQGFEVEMLREEERDDAPDVRNPKHWHLFHLVARKR